MTARIYKFAGRDKRPAPREKPAQVGKPAKPKQPPKVLLIVGEDEVREMLTKALTASGCHVTPHKLDPRYYTAILLDLFAKESFDIVIPTNLGIPFVYVPDLVTLARKYGKGVGIIVISGWVQDDFVAEFARTPRSAFFPAPVSIPDLTAKIHELSTTGTVSLRRMHVLFGDGKDDTVSEFLLECFVAIYGEIRDVRGQCLSSGEEILRIAEEEPVDLFILNLNLLWSAGAPFEDQIDFARHLKRKYRKPVIMITDGLTPEEKLIEYFYPEKL